MNVLRAAVVTAIARSFPLFSCGATVSISPKSTLTSPPSSAASAGAAPLNGTCVSLTPAMMLKSSPERCDGVPVPADEKFACFGFAFTQAMNSFTDAAATAGWTTSTNGLVVRTEIAA